MSDTQISRGHLLLARPALRLAVQSQPTFSAGGFDEFAGKAAARLRVAGSQPAARFGFERGRGRRGGTLLFDALYLARNEVLAKQKGRKAVIVLSDGRDSGSKVTIGQAIEAAQRADTLVYSILFSGQESFASPGFGGYGRRGGMGRFPQSTEVDGKKILQQLSRETGGGFFEVSKKETVDKVYGQIQEELRSQYSLGYTSDQPGGAAYRKISVTARPKNLTVQARDGYYAEPR